MSVPTIIREMVEVVLLNAAANRVALGDRRVPDTLAMLLTLVSWLSLPRGLLKFGRTTSMMLPVFTDLPSLRRNWIPQFLSQDHTYFIALA